MEQPERVYIGLGGNVGDAATTLAHAIVALGALPGATLHAVSRLYRTRPVGPVAQDDFLNAVVALDIPVGSDPEHAALALLDALKQLERSLGRRAGEHWGPREVDLDLLVFGHFEMHVERTPGARSDDLARARRRWLDVPHAAAAERLFVLAPLAELAPHLRPPGWPETVAEARARVAATEADDAVQVVATWDAPGRRWQPAERRR